MLIIIKDQRESQANFLRVGSVQAYQISDWFSDTKKEGFWQQVLDLKT